MSLLSTNRTVYEMSVVCASASSVCVDILTYKTSIVWKKSAQDEVSTVYYIQFTEQCRQQLRPYRVK
jgi:hypothetical protein